MECLLPQQNLVERPLHYASELTRPQRLPGSLLWTVALTLGQLAPNRRISGPVDRYSVALG